MHNKKYDWVLFDADETLFHFDIYQGLKLMFSRLGIDFSTHDFTVYQTLNKPLWVEYQNGTVTANELKQRRFQAWADKLSTTTMALNSGFLTAMADTCALLPGAKDLLETLSGKAQMGIITNGFTELQQVRLERTGVANYFEHVVISEQVGTAKPGKPIFEHTHQLINQPDKNRVLMVGDNLHSDILGGFDFGYDTCWLNPSETKPSDNIKPSYEIQSLVELKSIVLGE
ncbi:noncanonical pyrimidine nucleotidase, YjjG family [Vibrio sp. 10N.286.49.B3]|uniref:pyrimidine 5'-nucleotidase n=1 Tax=Vibrio sp. 10N.286.49.B3 TaxID=1880855 RepID=UPI000C8343A3|nr:pyrimidine 5'-nucleotidase [Vibrio sp. 10N.286.49.B3]PMH45021.1 noncanonical pyrimidine nucleotidase, YjjG family [Vibrio sp. 10N.286.49.B3]